MSEREDPLTGVKCFSIGGRMVEERQRCLGMTDEERRWRAQFLKDQVLSHDEPRDVPEYYKATTNFIRRLWRTPFWKFQKSLVPIVGPENAYAIRHGIGKFSTLLIALYVGCYYWKYCTNNFVYSHSLETMSARRRMYPDDPDYPNFKKKTKEEYVDFGFYSSPLAVKIEPPPPEPPKLPAKKYKADGSEIICPSPKP